MGTINVGKVRPVFRGAYSASTACNFFECWKYNDTWWLHIGVSPTTGTAPAEGAVWTAFGKKGDTGTAATIAIGTVTTGAAGSSVQVTNSGTAQAVVLNFTIPRGAKGDTGDGFSIYKTYASVAAMNADAANVAEGKFVLIASTVEDTDNAKLYVKSSGIAFTYLTDMSGATGLKGEPGNAATITVGTVTTGAAGTNAAVTNAGDENDAVFNFTIPRGATGATGAAATIAVGAVTTGAAGSSAAVTNAGTSSAATFNFTIPRGDKGDSGVSVTGASVNGDGELIITTDA